MRPKKTPRVLVYTANFGGKDELPYLINKHAANKNIEFIYVTDNRNAISKDYKVHVVKRSFLDTVKNARHYKICGIPDFERFDIAVWHDSSIVIDCSKLDDLIQHQDNILSVFMHDEVCTYSEARNALNTKKDNPIRVTIQMLYYGFLAKYPARNGVFETGIMVMKPAEFHHSELRKLWWAHVKMFSCRDQLSLPYAVWKTKSKVGILKGRGHDNPYSEFRGHKRSEFSTRNPLLKINSPFLRKVGLWLIFRAERHLSIRSRSAN